MPQSRVAIPLGLQHPVPILHYGVVPTIPLTRVALRHSKRLCMRTEGRVGIQVALVTVEH